VKALDWRAGGETQLVIDAPPREIYEIIADVTRIGERSPECRSATWLGADTAAVVGARFRGHNRSGRLARWSRTCEVLEAVPGVEFTFRTVPERDPSRRDSTIWSYRLVPEVAGTRVVHSYEVTLMPLPAFRFLYGLMLPHHRDMRPQMQDNLDALKAQLEQRRV
jgi:hypothetical protein